MRFRTPTPDDALDAVPESLAGSLTAVLGEPEADGCGCEAAFDGETLVVDAESCPHDGRLEDSEDCRAVVVEALTDRDATSLLDALGADERAEPYRLPPSRSIAGFETPARKKPEYLHRYRLAPSELRSIRLPVSWRRRGG